MTTGEDIVVAWHTGIHHHHCWNFRVYFKTRGPGRVLKRVFFILLSKAM